MTIQEALSRRDDVLENRGGIEEKKITWLAHLEAVIYNEVVLTHEGWDLVTYAPITAQTAQDTVLLAPEPYSELYIRYLIMQEDYALKDIEQYNNDTIQFADAYSSFTDWYNRTYMPLSPSGGRARF